MNITLLKTSISDFLTPKMLKYALLPPFISVLIIYILFFILGDINLNDFATFNIHTTQTTIINGIPNIDTTYTEFKNSSILEFFNSFVTLTTMGLFLLYLSIFISITILNFLTPFVLKEVQKKHYPDIEMIGYGNLFETLFLFMRYSFTMLFLFFIFIPLYFIPIINIIVFNIPLYYFFHKMITFDIASSLTTREENKKIKYFNARNLRLKTLALYILSLIPFTIFFSTVFYLIYLAHTYFTEIKKIREVL